MNNSDLLFRTVIRDLICACRHQQQITQEVMAEYLHISPRAYLAQEHGDYGFSAKTLASFLLFLPVEEREPTLEAIRKRMEWPDIIVCTSDNLYYRQINHLLPFLGADPRYKGYRYTEYALFLILENEQYLHAVSKWLYPEVARHFDTCINSVERNIRTVANVAWKTNRPRLEYIAGHPVPERPTASQFLAILAFWLEKIPVPARFTNYQ